MTGNILILRDRIQIQPWERTTVSYEYLSRLVAEYLLKASPEVDISAALSVMPATRSTSHSQSYSQCAFITALGAD